MKPLRFLVSSLPPLGLLVLQLSCGGDASGPGHVATSIAATSSTTLTAAPGATVTDPPSVIVRDETGSPMVGASVTFAVTSGGGSITGGRMTTNPSGIATVGSWTLGISGGANTLSATSGSLPAVTFTANAFDPCPTTAHTLGSTTDGQLSLSDCKFSDDSFVDLYAVTLPTSGTYIFSQTSTAFDAFLELLTGTGALVGVNNDFGAVGVTDSRVKLIVPAGSYIIAANSWFPDKTGSYSLVSAPSTEHVTNCEDVFVLRGITTGQSLQTTDCNTNSASPATGFAYDDYVIFLTAGQAITVAMTSSVLDSYLELRADGGSSPLVLNDNANTTTKNAQIAFTAATAGFYIITATSRLAGGTGDYTFSVQ